MTTAPVHSVKHVKATYHRYQILALVSAIATILAVLLAALFSYQLSRISKTVQRTAASQISATNQTLDNQITVLNKTIKELEERSAKDKETIKNLEAKTIDLNKKLAEARKAAEARAMAPTPPQADSTVQTPPSSEQTVPTPDETEQPTVQNETTGNTETTSPPVEKPAPTKPASEPNPTPPPAQEGSTQ